jgi:hypothetical protein
MTTDMIRKQIYINQEQQNKLRKLAMQRGTSEAEVIRQAIDRESSVHESFVFEDKETSFDQMLDEAFSNPHRPGGPYQFNRDEIYKERQARWIREDKE